MPFEKTFALVLAVASAALASPALAREGAGTLDDPIRIDALPYARKGTTVGAPSDVLDAYACADAIAERGPEVVFRVEVAEPGRLRAWVTGDGAGVDVDVHVLAATDRMGATATACLARGNTEAEADVTPGAYHVVVDTFGDGTGNAGPFVLRVDLAAEAWSERPIADGVVWKVRHFSDAAGKKQTQNALVIDPLAAGVALVPVQASGCETPSEIGRRTGALAAWNAGFFDTATGRCDSVSLLKVAGRLVATNASSRSAFGLDAMGRPLVDRIAAGADWPAASDAIGGVPRVVRAGAASVETMQEGISSASFIGPNPRTAMGIDGQGRILVLAADGRTEGASGLSLAALADALLEPGLGAAEAINYDGGGSTALWIAGTTQSGVVSYPSDDGKFDHAGERAVGSAWTLRAAPFDHAPRFQTAPPAAARAGSDFSYDADAIDLDVDDVVTFALESAPAGMRVDAAGVVSWPVPASGPAEVTAVLVASDGRNAARQMLRLAITGGAGAGGAGAGGAAGAAGAGVGGGDGAAGGASGPSGAGSSGAAGVGGAAGSPAGTAKPGGGCAVAPVGRAHAAWTSLLVLLGCASAARRRRR